MIYFTAHTIKYVCQSIRAMFRVLGVYNFAWVSKNPNFFSQINLFSFFARIEPKLNKLQKTVKIDKKIIKKTPVFL
jgi:hypothetical protein